jgi:DNA-binding transcriptional MocR family regulator
LIVDSPSTASWTPRLGRVDKVTALAIVAALEDDIAAGRLEPGQRLPTTRKLAEVLGVNPGTVARAFLEAQNRKLLVTNGRHGTHVRAHLPQARPSGAGRMDLRLSRALSPEINQLYALSLAAIGRKPAFLNELQGYNYSSGLDRHKAVFRPFLEASLGLQPEQILVVTAGAQHSLHTALAALCQPGDRVACEALTYPGLAFAAEVLHLELVPLLIDGEGLLPESLENCCAERPPKALICVPNHLNPTAATLPLSRRRQIVEIARRHGLWIIEDDVYGYLCEDRLPSLASLLPERTAVITSLSKAFTPALRVGFAIIPEALHDSFGRTLRGTTGGAQIVNAEILAEWIETGQAARLLRDVRQELRARNELLRLALGGIELAQNPCGSHIWLPMARDQSTAEFISHLSAAGIAVTPAETFWLGGEGCPQAVRISLTALPDRAAIDRLAVEIARAMGRLGAAALGEWHLV